MWAVSSDQPPDLLKAEADAGLSEGAEATHAFEAPNSTGFKEYKVLWSRDKLFEGKFDVARLEEALTNYPKNAPSGLGTLGIPGIGNVLGWVLGRRTEFIPFAPRRSHFWLDRDAMQEREKRNEFRSTTKIVARSWSLSENALSGLGTLGKTGDRQRSRIVS